MCCCDKPTINGQPGYKWQPNDAPITRGVNPPDLAEGEALLYDEPGRCGGSDSHSYHFRVTTERARVYLLVRHGGGDERMEFGWENTMLAPLSSLDSNGRYWLLCAAYHGMKKAVRDAREEVNATWNFAAAEGRIKTRKQRGTNIVKVHIEPATV